VGWEDTDSILITSQDTHVLVSSEIVRRKCTHLIEDVTEEAANLFLHVDLLLKEVKFVHPGVYSYVVRRAGDGVELPQLGNENLMDLLSQVFLHCAADRRSHILGEGFVDFLLVVVDCSG